MPIEIDRARNCLKSCDFKLLLIEELGWDHYSTQLEISVDSQNYVLEAVAEKKGMVIFLCLNPDNKNIPTYPVRRKIERQVAKSVHEHIIIYLDDNRTTQIWQWVKHEMGKPTACREHIYHVNQPGDSLIQKLQTLVFSLEEEENLTIVDVAGRTRSAFDVEKVTKKFYDRFKTEHDAFLKFINGIPDEEMLRWYTSVMLNRLMFIYFIQKKGFLDSDDNYLRNKLVQSEENSKDCFYKAFLCPLFFEGFAKKEDERSKEMNHLLGKIPYLNGGLFLKHQIEELYGEQIEITDNAFEKLFDFFDQYQWYLDERPLRADNEINPDVLGYIFEKYINQKQMGAYYTKEDITEYISKNTIIPFLFDAAKQKCKIAFEGEQSVWKLTQVDPDRYIYETMKKGVDRPLPEKTAQGLNDVSKRTEWNKSAPEEYALPTEIWREVVARRKRYEEIKDRMLSGEITSINYFITYNLNIRQFAQDVIENCEGPELLRAFYHAIENVTVLDPTCGSGAFLFAALNILEPLYEACLDRMEVFLDDLERSGEKHRSDKYGDFRKILKRIEEHPNRQYFILKSIIINNLFGVDIMEEAIEICKLRLFLKLVAQVEKIEQIEPLPDIDFNIRAGNTLVGFASYEDVKKALSSKLFSGDILKRVEEQAEEIESLFEIFRQMQTEQGMDSRDFADAKQEVYKRLKVLEDELSRYLASEYGIDTNKNSAYEKWLHSHKPFHWFIEFHEILKNGGFDVIIGNPPYVEYSVRTVDYQIKQEAYRTFPSRNLYSYVYERSKHLSRSQARIGMIVQISSISTPQMRTMVNEVRFGAPAVWISNYATRPSCLFEGVTMNLSIILSEIGDTPDAVSEHLWSTKYIRWNPESRPTVFSCVAYVEVPSDVYLFEFAVPKLTSNLEFRLLRRLAQERQRLELLIERSPNRTSQCLYYRTAGGRYFKIFADRPLGTESTSNKKKYLQEHHNVCAVIAVLGSNLWWWYYTLHFDMYNCKDYMMYGFRFDFESSQVSRQLSALGKSLVDSLFKNAEEKTQQYATTGARKQLLFKPAASKVNIDEIDRVLARHYGFTDEELDFIINYDIKYRMGRENQEEE